MYSNIAIGGLRYLCVEINGKFYVLGTTGRVGSCQDHSTMLRRA